MVADDDFLLLQGSASTMFQCLQNVENKAMDPPAPGLAVSCQVKGKAGQPWVEIDCNFLENALQMRGPHQLVKVMGRNPRTI